MTDEQIISRVIVEEGGSKLTNDAADRGGTTRFGITARGWTDYLRFRTGNSSAIATADDIRAITEDHAREFYRWLLSSSGIGRIQSQDVKQFVFDAAVNVSARQSIRFLQRALAITDDGVIGPATLAAVPYLNVTKLCVRFAVEEALYYCRLATGNLTDADRDGIPDNLEFLNGWMNRWAGNVRGIA